MTGGGEGDESLKVWDPRNGACTLSVYDAHLFHSAGEEIILDHIPEDWSDILHLAPLYDTKWL